MLPKADLGSSPASLTKLLLLHLTSTSTSSAQIYDYCRKPPLHPHPLPSSLVFVLYLCLPLIYTIARGIFKNLSQTMSLPV